MTHGACYFMIAPGPLLHQLLDPRLGLPSGFRASDGTSPCASQCSSVQIPVRSVGLPCQPLVKDSGFGVLRLQVSRRSLSGVAEPRSLIDVL